MKKMIIIIFLTTTMFADVDLTKKGETIFKNLNCHICHKINDDAASVGPSLRTIASHYLGDERRLVMFLKGEAKPIIDPARFEIMKPQLYKTKHMTFDEYRALAYYLTNFHKNR